MRLWTFHPKYLDSKGLVALWREGLLALHVLCGRTRGYKNHPQLLRFRALNDPVGGVSSYLTCVYQEAQSRKYTFDQSKIPFLHFRGTIPETEGQLKYEWELFREKLKQRNPALLQNYKNVHLPAPHPLFRLIQGTVNNWEKLKSPAFDESV